MQVFTYPAEEYSEANIDKRDILKFIKWHRNTIVPELDKKKQYYLGEHDIIRRRRKKGAPNIRAVCNHAKDIADTASSYFMGNPITYNNTGDAKIEQLLEAFDAASIDDVDSDNALDLSIYGRCYDYVYVKKDETTLSAKNLEPGYTFIVYDDTIEQQPLYGVYYFPQTDTDTQKTRYLVSVLTTQYKYVFTAEEEGETASGPCENPEPHHMGDIPITEYKNNKDCIGDFEQQIGLIDAYNTLMSDRVNDKEQFIDAILVIYGTLLGDTESESSEAAKALRDLKLLELPSDAKAEYLTRSLDESGVEVLRKALKEDIYTFSHVPNLTDENFAANASGVAMGYKLLGLEMITKIKTRYYKQGLRRRIKLFCGFLGLKQIEIEAGSIVPVFSRSLPQNLLELAQIVASLKGAVGQRTLLQLLPFVEDPEKEIEEVAKENEEAVARQKAALGLDGNPLPDESEADVGE